MNDLAGGGGITVDLAQVNAFDLSAVEHLVCEWTGMEVLSEAGISRTSAVGKPGG
jgi:hypothetical protein